MLLRWTTAPRPVLSLHHYAHAIIELKSRPVFNQMSVLLLCDGCSTNYHYHPYPLQKTWRAFPAIMKLMPHTLADIFVVPHSIYWNTAIKYVSTFLFFHILLYIVLVVFLVWIYTVIAFLLLVIVIFSPYLLFLLEHPHANQQFTVISISMFSINHLISKCTGVIWKCWEDALNSFAFILSAIATALYKYVSWIASDGTGCECS